MLGLKSHAEEQEDHVHSLQVGHACFFSINALAQFMKLGMQITAIVLLVKKGVGM